MNPASLLSSSNDNESDSSTSTESLPERDHASSSIFFELLHRRLTQVAATSDADVGSNFLKHIGRRQQSTTFVRSAKVQSPITIAVALNESSTSQNTSGSQNPSATQSETKSGKPTADSSHPSEMVRQERAGRVAGRNFNRRATQANAAATQAAQTQTPVATDCLLRSVRLPERHRRAANPKAALRHNPKQTANACRTHSSKSQAGQGSAAATPSPIVSQPGVS